MIPVSDTAARFTFSLYAMEKVKRVIGGGAPRPVHPSLPL